MNKKGNINQLFPAVMAIILVGALLFVGITILSSFSTTAYLSTTNQTANETAPGVIKESGQTFAGVYRNAVCSSFTCYNQTGTNLIVPAANYTVTGCNVAYSHATDTVGYNNSIWKCTYTKTYDADTTASTSVDSVNTSISTLASTWLPLIVVVLAAGIVLAILLGAFSGKRK